MMSFISPLFPQVLFRRLRTLCQQGPGAMARLVLHVLHECLAYVAVLAAFATFVYANGGLVVGDRSAHEATVHVTQVGAPALKPLKKIIK